jgi:2-phospho-L-lactate guanylyltransferase
VQGTVKTYDTDSRTGSLLTDDRAEIAIDARSFGDPPARFLRIGQRVRFEVETAAEGTVARDLHLVTF